MQFVHLEKINNRYRGPFEEHKYVFVLNNFVSAISYIARKFENIKFNIYKLNANNSININVNKCVENINDSLNKIDSDIQNMLDQIMWGRWKLLKPFVLRNKAILNGISSSSDFNKLLNDVIVDLIDLRSQANSLELDMKQKEDAISFENMLLRSKLSELEQQIEDLKYNLENYVNNNTIRRITVHSSNSNLITNESASIFYNYSIITPHISEVYSKVLVGDTVNMATNIRLYESTDGNTYVEKYNTKNNVDLFKIIDKKFDDGVVFKSRANIDVDSLYIIVEIDVPTDYINNLSTNRILINPFPALSMDLLSIEYKSSTNDIWKPLNGFIQMNSIKDTMIIFNKTNICSLRLTFKQKYFIASYDDALNTQVKDFIYGFKDISIDLVKTKPGISSFVATVVLPETKNFDTVYEPKLIFNDLTKQNRNYTTTLFLDKNLSNAFYYNKQIPLNTSKIYIKVDLINNSDDLFGISSLICNFTTR